MKKYLRKGFCLLLICSLMATMSGTVFATNSIKEDGGLTGPTQLFFEVCDNLFAKSSTYRVIDKNGKDVTSQFLNDYQDYYFSGNYYFRS